jgi:hypothetical protein
LPCEVEQEILLLYQILHPIGVANVGDVDAELGLQAVDVEEIAPVIGNQGIDQKHFGAEVDEAMSEVASNEAETPGDECLLALEVLSVSLSYHPTASPRMRGLLAC